MMVIVYSRHPPLLLSVAGLGRLQAAGRQLIGFIWRMIVHDSTSDFFCEGWWGGLDFVAHTIAVQNRRSRIGALWVLYQRRAWGRLDPYYFWRMMTRKILCGFASWSNPFWTWSVGSYVYLPYILSTLCSLFDGILKRHVDSNQLLSHFSRVPLLHTGHIYQTFVYIC